jgi:hypothetical protein
MTDPLADLSSEEQWAAGAVARATGATAEAHDIGGWQGVVDVTLTYPNGRSGAVEVTSYAEEGTQERDVILAGRHYRWPNPGAGHWSITLRPSARIAALKRPVRPDYRSLRAGWRDQSSASAAPLDSLRSFASSCHSQNAATRPSSRPRWYSLSGML